MTAVGHSSLPPPPPPPPHATPNQFGTAWWGLGDAVASFGIFIGVSFALTIVALIASGDIESTDIPDNWLPVLIAGPALAGAAYVVSIGRRKGNGVIADFRYQFRWIDLAIGLGLGLGALFTAGLTAVATEAILGDEPEAAIVQELDSDEGFTVAIVLVLLLIPIMAPLVEELVYRGLWWSALAKRGLSEGWCLAITSIVFAAAHLEVRRFFVLLVLGFAIGAGRMITGRVGPSIVAHAAVNTLAAIALAVEIS